MDVMMILIPVAIVMALVGLWALFWSFKTNQYEDMEGVARRILLDDDEPPRPQ